jgi:hypothetical protein
MEQIVVDGDPGMQAESGNEPSPRVATAADGPRTMGAADSRTPAAAGAIEAGAPDAAGAGLVTETVFGFRFAGHDPKVERRLWSKPVPAAHEPWAAGDSVDDSMRLVSPWIRNLSDAELDRMLEVYRRKVRQGRTEPEKDP